MGTVVLERVTGIEPASSAWEADVLPLNYTREMAVCRGREDTSAFQSVSRDLGQPGNFNISSEVENLYPVLPKL